MSRKRNAPTRKKLAKRPRSEIQADLWQVVNAVLDSEHFITSHGRIHFAQHDNDFGGYILLATGELTEARYDVLREVVNVWGGIVNVMAPKEEGEFNIRIWIEHREGGE